MKTLIIIPTQQHNNTTTQQHNNTTTQQHNNTTTQQEIAALNIQQICPATTVKSCGFFMLTTLVLLLAVRHIVHIANF